MNTPNDWREIPGYGGAYQINRMGDVQTYRWRGERFTTTPRPLTAYIRAPRGAQRKSGRRFVKLTGNDGKAKEVAVLQLMVRVWAGGPRPGLVAYHRNGDLADNCLHNIAFATREELGRKTGAKAARRPVAKVTPGGEIVAYYPSAREAAKANHMSYQTVLDRCNGKVKKPFALDGHTYIFDE